MGCITSCDRLNYKCLWYPEPRNTCTLAIPPVSFKLYICKTGLVYLQMLSRGGQTSISEGCNCLTCCRKMLAKSRIQMNMSGLRLYVQQSLIEGGGEHTQSGFKPSSKLNLMLDPNCIYFEILQCDLQTCILSTVSPSNSTAGRYSIKKKMFVLSPQSSRLFG